MEVKNENQAEEKVCGCETEGICNCVDNECGCENNTSKEEICTNTELIGIDYAAPVEGSITGLTPELIEEEIEANRLTACENMKNDIRDKFEDRIYPQLRRIGVSEDRLVLFDDIMVAFGMQGHSGTTAPYVHNLLALGINDGWDKLDEVITKTLESAAADPENDGYQDWIVANIRELEAMIIDANFNEDEGKYLLRIMSSKPLVPVEGLDDEWMSLEEFGDTTLEQNRICTSIFRNKGDNSTAHYLYANSYTSDGGITWFTGNNNGLIQSSQPITFPFEVPESSNHIYVEEIAENEYVDVTGNEERIKFIRDYCTKYYSYEGKALTFAEACTKVNKDTQYRSVLTDQNIVIHATNNGIEVLSDKEGYGIEIDRLTRFIAECPNLASK